MTNGVLILKKRKKKPIPIQYSTPSHKSCVKFQSCSYFFVRQEQIARLGFYLWFSATVALVCDALDLWSMVGFFLITSSQPCAFLLVTEPLFRSSIFSNQKYVNCLYGGCFFCLQVQITTLCISISLSATVALVCLFTPKMYIIVFQPEKNVRRLTMNSASYKKPVTNTSSVLGANNHGNVIVVHFCQWHSQTIQFRRYM